MKTFNVEVKFTPAYHAATNGAIERRHQTIKNALKASLIDMGNKHQDKWMRALPWVLLGKRTAYQPDLDTSSAMLAFGRSPLLPGQLLGHPGPPLTNLQTKSLLEEMYKLESNAALPTSSKTTTKDISVTENATHVYVKIDEPKGLSCRYEGPYKIISRPSRSQIEVRVGSYANGSPRTSIYHWSSCKPAHLRPDFVEGSRPNVGRKPRPDPPASDSQLRDVNNATELGAKTLSPSQPSPNQNFSRGKIQNDDGTVLDPDSGRQVHPDYVSKGPVITTQMFDQWTPEVFKAASPDVGAKRPVRSTRNANPMYVGSIAWSASANELAEINKYINQRATS